MKKNLLVFSLIYLCVLLLISSCKTRENKSKTTLYPNDDSDLTLLMRDMYDYYAEVKIDIQKGKKTDRIKAFDKIHSAEATNPAKSESDVYKAMAAVYLNSVESLNKSLSSPTESFNHMVDNCMACHKQMCPGPMVKIKKLYLTEGK